MKFNLTTLMCVLLCAVISIFAFASCDESGNTDDTTKTPEESTTETSPNEDSGEDEPIDSTVTDGETNEEPDDSTIPDNSSDTTGEETPDSTTSEVPDDTTTPVPHIHNYYIISVKEPTCTEKGYTKHICDCGEFYNDSFAKEYGHTEGEWKTEKEATASEDGIKNQYCSVCGVKLRSEIIKATATIGLAYTPITGGYSVSVGACGNLSEIFIPETYNGLPVTSIGGGAFYGCYNLDSITIPDSVTSIGDSAFYGCTSLASVYITDIEAWCKIKFDTTYSNPLYYAHNLLLLLYNNKPNICKYWIWRNSICSCFSYY